MMYRLKPMLLLTLILVFSMLLTACGSNTVPPTPTLEPDDVFVEGETIPVILTFEKAGTIEVTMRVKRGSNVVAQH